MTNLKNAGGGRVCRLAEGSNQLLHGMLKAVDATDLRGSFKTFLCFVEVALSFEGPASEVYLVPNHVHMPLCMG